MEKIYRAFKERQAQRRKILVYSLVLLALWALIGFYTNFEEYWLFIGLIFFIIGFPYVMTRSWAQEMVETDIFVLMYESAELLELCTEKNEGTKFYSRKAVGKVSDAIRNLGILHSKLEKTLSKLYRREFAEPLKQLKENLSTRILPRIAKQEDIVTMISVLRGLADLFGEVQKPLRLDDLVSKNKDLERFEPMEFEKPQTLQAFKNLVSSRPSKFLFSIFLGYILIICIVWIFSQFLNIDFIQFMKNNLVGVISGGAVFSGVIIGIIFLKK